MPISINCKAKFRLEMHFFFFPKIQPDGLFGRNSWNMLILEQEIKDCPDAGSKRKVLVRPRPSILSQTCQIQPNLRYWVANDLKKKKKIERYFKTR